MTIAVDLGRKATKQTNNNILFMFNSTMTIKHAFADQHQVLASRKKIWLAVISLNSKANYFDIHGKL